ncbi:unnamed protein product [Triticum turgidum subsp. durum]|uniref:Uncharacterized protein n=1 Tax=Triticum turgidum subsp. durum TaxID=4567 RepID=A0A9R1NZB2_TRITD|nr:unnamed protein product [Triticum turgidum subsp. durum]
MCHRGLASSLWHRAPEVQALSSLQKLCFPCSTPRPMPAPLRLAAVPPSTSCCCRTLPIGHCGRVVSSLSRSNGRRLHETPSSTTVLQEFGFDKFDDAIVHLRYRDRQDRLNETPKYLYERKRQVLYTRRRLRPLRDSSSTTAVDPRRPCGRQVPFRDPEPLRKRCTSTSVAKDPCTTTVALYDYLDHERPEDIYFLYFAPNENHLLHASKV